MPRSVFHKAKLDSEIMAPAGDTPGSDPNNMKDFSSVEWCIGEESIVTAVSALKLVKVKKELILELLMCSGSAALADAVNDAVGHNAGNRTGRRLLMNGALDCGVLYSDNFCVVVEQPPFSLGERPFIAAAHFAPIVRGGKRGGKMGVCALLGTLLPKMAANDQAKRFIILVCGGVAAGTAALITIVTALIICKRRNSKVKGTVAT